MSSFIVESKWSSMLLMFDVLWSFYFCSELSLCIKFDSTELDLKEEISELLFIIQNRIGQLELKKWIWARSGWYHTSSHTLSLC